MTLFSLALPAFLQTFFNSLIGTVNTLLLSGYADDTVGATTAANQIISTATLILNMTYIGAAVLVSIAFDLSNAKWAIPKPLYKQKEITKRFIAGMLSLFLSV